MIASAPVSHNKSVWPSLALATKSLPVLPLAPGLFSTTTVCFSASASGWLMARAMMSDEPPGGYGTMMRTVLLGHACACTAQAANKVSAATARRAMGAMRAGVMSVSLG